MVIMKASPSSEAGVMPTEQDFQRMISYNEELVKAGIMKSGDGLKSSKFGKRVSFRGNGKMSVVDGPFAETKELIAGYWLWEVKSVDEALEWVKRCPQPMSGEEFDIEIRPFFEAEDFGAEFTPELQERVDDMRRKEAGRSN
jgi:hypothetical protein